jgi:hypothetical protein
MCGLGVPKDGTKGGFVHGKSPRQGGRVAGPPMLAVIAPPWPVTAGFGSLLFLFPGEIQLMVGFRGCAGSAGEGRTGVQACEHAIAQVPKSQGLTDAITRSFEDRGRIVNFGYGAERQEGKRVEDRRGKC